MIRFLRGYAGHETSGVKYRRGEAVSLRLWQEVALVQMGVAETITQPKPNPPPPRKTPARRKKTTK